MLVLGVAYKADVSDVRESPAFDIISYLSDQGAEVSIYDPHVSQITVGDELYTSISDPVSQASASDIVAVLTEHNIDFEKITESAPLVFDTRNVVTNSASHVHLL